MTKNAGRFGVKSSSSPSPGVVHGESIPWFNADELPFLSFVQIGQYYARGGTDGLEIRVPSISKGQGIPAPPWMGWESSPLAPRHYRWQVRLGRGPCMLAGETPGSATLPIGYGGLNTSPNHLA